MFLGLQGVLFAQPAQKAILTLNADLGKATISRHIYGHFSEHLGHCIYGGFYVGDNSKVNNVRGIRTDVVEALKAIKIPNLRWPGGCFADEYHWMDGIGPKEKRAKMINTHWGGVVEDNSFGTHEFFDLCEQLGAEPYICGNVGSGSVEEMSKWVEYISSDAESPMTNLRRQNGRAEPWKVKFWAVGNESWGCGGNMTAEYYTDQFRRYGTFCRNYGTNRLAKVAGGASDADYNWTETCMKNIPLNQMWGLSLHHYTVTGTWDKKGSATDFTEQEYFTTMKKCLETDELITKHSTIMDRYDPNKRVGLVVDEWGIWTDPEPGTNPGFLFQQNSLRDAFVAAISLNIFNRHCDRVKMANLAQTVNVLQALVFTNETQMVLTPTYWVFDMYKVHQDATLLPLEVQCGDYVMGKEKIKALHTSASKDASGAIHISIANVDPKNSVDISCMLRGVKAAKVTGQIITGKEITTCNTFEQPDNITLKDFNGASMSGETLSAVIPAKSIVTLEIK